MIWDLLELLIALSPILIIMFLIFSFLAIVDPENSNKYLVKFWNMVFKWMEKRFPLKTFEKTKEKTDSKIEKK